MKVIKRNGNFEDISFDKILNRIKKIGNEVNLHLNYSSLAMKIIDQLYNEIHTSKIDELTADQCASLSTNKLEYSILASRIIISNHHKNTKNSFYETMLDLYENKDSSGKKCSLISNEIWEIIHSSDLEWIENAIDYERDYLIDYFGFKTLERNYLFKSNEKSIERPQHMWMRVSLGIHGKKNIQLALETYHLMSLKYFTHATPTLFNAGTNRPQLSSCYLISMKEDSIEGIYDTLKDCALISKYAGGIGLHIHDIRAKGSRIKGTNGITSGIVPMLRVFNNTARYIDQGGGKRNGSFAIYLEPWHADIESFLELKNNHGDEELKARDLFYALWIPDLFMERVKENGSWSLFCPDMCPGLANLWGEDFNQLYISYELKKMGKVILARDLWYKILNSQMETGTPYLLFKDSANKKSNQQNLGTIKSSNLCCEIIQYSDELETAVCNLASLGLPSFVDKKTKEFNYKLLHNVTKVVTNNLNKIIDINFYPTDKTKLSNLNHRPIGIGVQGLADVFFLMDVAFHSEEAKIINKLIFETIYHGALEQSNEMSISLYNAEYNKDEYNKNKDINLQFGAYKSFNNSPASKGILQFDLWNCKPSNRYDWDLLKQNIQKFGIRNSLLVAPMPTASTSQILGFNECFEPITSNIYSRRTLAGDFIVTNKYLMKELTDLGLWNEQIKQNIIANKGSIQQLTMLPEHLRNKYKIVWEIPMKHIIDMASDRGIYICQSQSMNLWIEDPNYSSLTSMHFYSWSKGLKTGIYYLRRKGKHQAQQFTIEPTNNNEKKEQNDEICEEICEMCSA